MYFDNKLLFVCFQHMIVNRASLVTLLPPPKIPGSATTHSWDYWDLGFNSAWPAASIESHAEFPPLHRAKPPTLKRNPAIDLLLICFASNPPFRLSLAPQFTLFADPPARD
jgi:hypothetical protein